MGSPVPKLASAGLRSGPSLVPQSSEPVLLWDEAAIQAAAFRPLTVLIVAKATEISVDYCLF